MDWLRRWESVQSGSSTKWAKEDRRVGGGGGLNQEGEKRRTAAFPLSLLLSVLYYLISF